MYTCNGWISNGTKAVKDFDQIALLKSSSKVTHDIFDTWPEVYNSLWPCVKNVKTWPILQGRWRLCRPNIGLIWKTMPCSYASQPVIQAQIQDFFPPLFCKIASRCSFRLFSPPATPITTLLLPTPAAPPPNLMCVILVQNVPNPACFKLIFKTKGMIKMLTWACMTRKLD